LEPSPVWVFGNANQLEQVFLNLLLNALDAMPEGGTITVRTTCDDHAAQIRIVDTGVGIPRAIMDRLFEPFNTSKETGIGLGLSIVRRIIRDHQGQIRVQSEPGNGTTFIIDLTLATPDESAQGTG
ncbi:MAG: HAMP domain-containing sensor histidine kinase, partial [Candidatus Poribacteria bacterium]|nr:HAMP domain-containing sensor histidine kinase [Candidatus Poribacteria bacterium]